MGNLYKADSGKAILPQAMHKWEEISDRNGKFNLEKSVH